MEHLTEKEATEFFSEFYRGEHHIPGYKVSPCGYGWSVNHDRGPLSTFDFSDMTRLTFMGHDKCIRVEVSALKSNLLRIAIWRRDREGSMDRRHPTLESAIESFRGVVIEQKTV